MRENAQRVEVYNSGLMVFLYDEANREAINEADPSVLGGFNPEEALEDTALQQLAQDGALVLYELRQDDELDIAVWTGAPPTDDELAFGRWLPPQIARLNLPSGKLSIESYDSLLVGEEEPTDPNAVVQIEPGDYILSLYRVDWDAIEEAGLSDDFQGPWEIIVLTPRQEAATAGLELPDPQPAMLLYPLE